MPEPDEDRDERAAWSPRHYLTERGFVRLDFADEYGKACSLQESSLGTQNCIWLGRGDQRMHLTQAQVLALLPSLQHFADEGTLPQPPEEG